MDKEQIRKEIVKFWDATGQYYDSQPFHGIFSEEEEEEWNKFFKEVIPDGTKKILEVGGGTGFVALRLARLGYFVKCTDISEGMIAEAKKKAKEAGLEDIMEFGICDAQKTGEPDESFDVVINRQMMWMLPEPEKAVDDWLRIVKPGGKVIIIAGDGKRSEKDKKEKSNNMGMMKKDSGPEWFSEELLESLPMVRGDKSPEEFMKHEGARLSIITLDDIRDAEDKAIEKMTGENTVREPRKVYIITKEVPA